MSWGAQYHDNYGHLECKPKRIPTLLGAQVFFFLIFFSNSFIHFQKPYLTLPLPSFLVDRLTLLFLPTMASCGQLALACKAN